MRGGKTEKGHGEGLRRTERERHGERGRETGKDWGSCWTLETSDSVRWGRKTS